MWMVDCGLFKLQQWTTPQQEHLRTGFHLFYQEEFYSLHDRICYSCWKLTDKMSYLHTFLIWIAVSFSLWSYAHCLPVVWDSLSRFGGASTDQIKFWRVSVPLSRMQRLKCVITPFQVLPGQDAMKWPMIYVALNMLNCGANVVLGRNATITGISQSSFSSCVHLHGF